MTTVRFNSLVPLMAFWCSLLVVECQYFENIVQQHHPDVYVNGPSWGGRYQTGYIRTGAVPGGYFTARETIGAPSWGISYPSGYLTPDTAMAHHYSESLPVRRFYISDPRSYLPDQGSFATGTHSTSRRRESSRRICRPVGDHKECYASENEEKFDAKKVGNQKGTIDHTKEEREYVSKIE